MKQIINKVIILVNLDSNNNYAEKKWRKIADSVLDQLPRQTEVIEYHIPFDIEKCLQEKIIQEKANCIISAGGDGSANIILNELIRIQDQNNLDISLGFIGLGSSNDILKPCNTIIDGIRLKINLKTKFKNDIGLATFRNVDGFNTERYFLANSSIGVGACANWLFNQDSFLVRFLKARWLNLAITYVTIKSIINFKNFPAQLIYANKSLNISVSHLSILKNPHISGELKFDQKIAPDDGQMGLNICDNMSKFELINVLTDLKKGRFSGKPKRHSLFVKRLEVQLNKLVPVEFDGEIELTQKVNYKICPKALNILQ